MSNIRCTFALIPNRRSYLLQASMPLQNWLLLRQIYKTRMCTSFRVSLYLADVAMTLDALGELQEVRLTLHTLHGEAIVSSRDAARLSIQTPVPDTLLEKTSPAKIYQPHDEVVKNRKGRKKMLADDCECCCESVRLRDKVPRGAYVECSTPCPHAFTGKHIILYPVSVGCAHMNVTENGKEGVDFTTGCLEEPFDIIPVDFGGEVTAGYPDFPEGSAAACKEVSGPLDLNAPDIIYAAEDVKAINQFHRDIMQTIQHSLGTCAMKSEAGQGVIGARPNVYSTLNMNIADTSISTLNVGTKMYSMALLIGGRAAIVIAEDLGINCV
ncbi:uncharacterized protein EDB93DRAFT_1107659 [Suillus bovinus]|uniref:uncharacterized protein n=1 Tax=Suillus bovinus TaxID=48563 RepID=UPI001B871A40|nr:uncharacterized protein EDB93DRAFT_1107659 [Suillus bovinus]KAG2133194.1 hypothetical protein EDB93DRAFT_1107659 [Suillus bovinus]